MLTLRTPIEITARTNYMTDSEAFYRRITGSYALMETGIAPEDLLHVAATPPEIYVAESEGMTSILSRNERNETNVHKVEIFNNVLNRILLSADVGLTYQDRVFITDALYKLGIQDDRQFMTDFYRLAQETKNTNALINLYLNHVGELQELKELRETSDTRREVQTETVWERTEDNTLYLHIMERLKTGAIYQIVSNFNRSGDDYRIDAGEYTVAPQSYLAQQILLGRLREIAGTGSAELVYRSENRYEEKFYEGDVDETHVEQTLSAAVLMELAQNLYRAGYERFDARNEAYYRFEDSLYRSATEILNRIHSAQTSITVASATVIRQIEVTNQAAGREITLLNRIFESDEGDVIHMLEQFLEQQERREAFYREENRIRENQILQVAARRGEERPAGGFAPADMTFSENIVRQYEGDVYSETQQVALQQEFKESLYRQLSEENFYMEGRAEEAPEESGAPAALTLTERQAQTEERREAPAPGSVEEAEAILRAVDEINVQNELRRQKFEEIMQRTEGARTPQTPEEQMERTRADAMLALHQPEILKERLREQENRQTVRERTLMREIREILPPQGAQAWQLLQQYEENPQIFMNGQSIRTAEVGELVRELNLVEREQQSAGTGEAAEGEAPSAQAVSAAARSTAGSAPHRGSRLRTPSPVNTIHRQMQTLTGDELTETIQELENRVSRQVKRTVQEEVTEATKVTTGQTQVFNEVKQQEINQIDIDKLVGDGVRRRMNAISDQVYQKLERRMQSEKIRRGF